MRKSLIAVLLCAACSKGAAVPGKIGDACATAADCGTSMVCTDTPVGRPATPGQKKCAAPGRHYTFRALAGISMGSVGGSRLVAAHPEKFDAAVLLGGPLDATLLMETLEKSFLAGFCPSAQLEAAAALDAQDGKDRLDDPNGIAGCTPQNPPPLTQFSRSQRFNHWAFTTNGGTFDRGTHLDIFRDLTLALGNPLSMPLTADQLAAATCASPAVVPHVYDATYSPHGEHSAITFCDGDSPIFVCADGAVVDWCGAAALAGRNQAQRSDAAAWCAAGHGGGAHEADPTADADAYFAHKGEIPGCYPSSASTPVPFALAIDINGNGRRDYNEPILVQAHEPFTDTNGNGRWDPGEPFEDVGLDGVAGTGDFGEGDGQFTVSPGLKAWYDGDLTLHVPSNVDFYVEGGIRDIFDLGAMAKSVSTALPGLTPFLGFFAIPRDRGAWGTTFDPQRIEMSALGRNVLLEYGNPNATQAQIRAGDGDHVGTPDDLVDRFMVSFRWLSREWDAMLPTPGHGTPATHDLSFVPQGLGAPQDFVVSTPAGYDDAANAQRRYPVIYLLHGYGMNAEDMAGTTLAIDILADLGLMHDAIVVFPSGRCCLKLPDGSRTCDESHGTPDGAVRECARGSFYLDRPGANYAQAFFELMDEVDSRYRTLSPADGPAF